MASAQTTPAQQLQSIVSAEAKSAQLFSDTVNSIAVAVREQAHVLEELCLRLHLSPDKQQLAKLATARADFDKAIKNVASLRKD